MILANPIEAMFPLVLIFMFIVLMTLMKNRSQQHRDKMDIIQKALDSGAIDENAKREMLEALSGQNWVKQHQRNVERAARVSEKRSFGRFMFGIGWMGLFLGVVLFLAGLAVGEEELLVGGAVVGGIAFGIVTLPFAFRELDRPANSKSKPN